MPRTVKIAVIGTGKLGSHHAKVLSKLKQAELVGVCDIDEGRAKEVARRCKTKAYRDYRDLLPLVEAACIVVPSELHYSISKEFLENNVHLLIEKPITTELSHADALLKIARKNNVLIQVGHIERYNSAIRTIKKVVKNPRFIECHRLGPYDPRVADVGVTIDLMIHDIDIVLDIVQSPTTYIDSVGAHILSQTEDIANARIRFKNNCVCDLTASRVTDRMMRKIRIFQDNAYISLDYVTQEADIYTREDGKIRLKKIDIAKSNPLQEEITDFIHCVRTERKPLVSGEEGRTALALALQVSDQIKKIYQKEKA